MNMAIVNVIHSSTCDFDRLPHTQANNSRFHQVT